MDKNHKGENLCKKRLTNCYNCIYCIYTELKRGRTYSCSLAGWVLKIIKALRLGLRAAANRCETQGALRFMKLKLCKSASFRSCEPVIP